VAMPAQMLSRPAGAPQRSNYGFGLPDQRKLAMNAPPGASGGVRSEAQLRNRVQQQGGRNDDEAFRRIQEL